MSNRQMQDAFWDVARVHGRNNLGTATYVKTGRAVRLDRDGKASNFGTNARVVSPRDAARARARARDIFGASAKIL